MLSSLSMVPTSPRGAAQGAVATRSLNHVSAVGEFPGGGREKSCSSMKAPLPCNLFPLALVEAWEPYIRAMLCHATGWPSPCLAPLYIITILMGGDHCTLLHVTKTTFPAVPSRVRAEMQAVFFSFSPKPSGERASAPAQGGHRGAIGQKAAPGEAGDSLLLEANGSKEVVFSFVRAEAEGVRSWQGCDLRAGMQNFHCKL